MLSFLNSHIKNSAAYNKAVLLIIISSALTAAIGLFCKIIVSTLQNFPFTTLIIYLIPLIFLYCIIKLINHKQNKTEYLGLYFLAAIFKIASSYCFIYYLFHSSLLNATVLSYTNSIFVLLLYKFFFKVTLRWQNLISILTCFSGIVVIVHPNSSIFDHYFWCGLLNGVLSAISSVIIFYLTKKEDDINLTFSFYLFTTIIALMIAVVFIKIDNIETIVARFDMSLGLIITFFAILVVVNRFILINSFALVDRPSSITPFFYITPIFAALLDIFYYGHHPHSYTYIGGAIIILGDLIMFYQCDKSKNLKFTS